MGYFDTFASAHFKKLDDGTVIFYPYKKKYGYILNSEKEKKAKQVLKNYQMVNIFLTPIVIVTLSSFLHPIRSLHKFVYFMLFVSIYSALSFLIYYLNVKKIIGNIEKTFQKRTKEEMEETKKNLEKSMPIPFILFAIGILLFVIYLGIYNIIFLENLLLGLFVILFSGWLLVFYIKAAINKITEKGQQEIHNV